MKKIFLILFSLLLLVISNKAFASSIDFKTEKIDENSFYLYVNLESDELINAGDLNLKFDNNLVKFESILNNESIFNLWVKKPKNIDTSYIKLIGGTVKAFSGYGNITKIKFQKLKNININNIDFIKIEKGYIAEANGIGNNTIKY